eukprot:5767519-Pyramimonas_sp.AAC.1
MASCLAKPGNTLRNSLSASAVCSEVAVNCWLLHRACRELRARKLNDALLSEMVASGPSRSCRLCCSPESF